MFSIGRLRPRPARETAALLVVVGLVTLVRGRKRAHLAAGLASACAYAVPVAITVGVPRSRVRDSLVWAAHMWAYKNAFEMPFDDESRLRRRAHIDYPIAFDTRLGMGLPPGQRLQCRLRRRGRLSPLDKALSILYWTWEAEPHLALAWVRWRHERSFAAAAARLAATFDLTLVGYWLLPTAPPWWASEQAGRLDREVCRVMSEVASWLKRERESSKDDHEMGANPFAAMPSDHFASAVMTAMLLAELDTTLGSLAWAYALLLGFALVYLGEHYVLDLIEGLCMALVVKSAGAPLGRAGARLLDLGPSR